MPTLSWLMPIFLIMAIPSRTDGSWCGCQQYNGNQFLFENCAK
jgi:hypothetical protein